MLNPSTADGEQDDPTIRRCVGFAKAWGFGSLIVINLFAYRATKPRALKDAGYPVGPENGEAWNLARHSSTCIVAAWGPNGRSRPDYERVFREFPNMMCLGWSQSGEPRHPLMIPSGRLPFNFVINGRKAEPVVL